MEKTYYLEDVTIAADENPRHFTITTGAEIEQLQVGKLVRLFTRTGARNKFLNLIIPHLNGVKRPGIL